jgi:hypothetical protein
MRDDDSAMSANEVLRFGDPEPAAWLMAGLLVVALVLGATVYGLASNPARRRPEFQDLGSCSKPVSLALGAILFAVLSLGIYVTQFGDAFYEAEIDGDVLRLRGSFPAREVELRRADVERLAATELHVRGRPIRRLTIRVDGGGEHESGDASAEEIATGKARIGAWLAETAVIPASRTRR